MSGDDSVPRARRPRTGTWRVVLAALCVVTALAGALVWSGRLDTTPPDTLHPDVAASAAADPTRLDAAAPCPGVIGFTCGFMSVPLDRGGRVPGTLRLGVAVSTRDGARRGTLLLLTGGPGQPGVSLVPRMLDRIGYLLDDYRLVMIDQRGTGSTAIDCPRLQAEVGSSDITPASPQAISECVDVLGPARDFYTTGDTVADLDDLRRTLGVTRWTLDGVSYGSFVAAQYALTHPAQVERLVLDSVVPLDGGGTLYEAALQRTPFVLRQACQEQSCGFDPVAALTDVVRRHDLGVGVFDLLVTASIVDPGLKGPPAYEPVLRLLRDAADGDLGPLTEAIAEQQGGAGTPATAYSAGLHLATLCADLTDAPWGDSTAPPAGRSAKLAEAAARVDTGPYDARTAAGQGIAHNCALWPPTRPNVRPSLGQLTMPVLLLAGDRDLSTPLVWAQATAEQAPRGRLAVIAGMGHSIQGRHPEGDAAVRAFLLEPV
ncbi:alpha/beta fold hydrolase [Catellatospora citrea]|uniref:alpha/beta fold hydrolase n=1 Tax=Catellatospora citrea TaxID=53366 RepID=UPI0011C4601E|nr:alpha/beta hydrolase [Catellatospora citrea]